jgi:hypothetical protein
MSALATVIQNDYPIDELQSQILSARDSSKNAPSKDVEKEEVTREKSPAPKAPTHKMDQRKFVFRKGDQVFEVDEDAELEFMADKKPTRLSLRDLKDRAAGDIAVKNRMHSLAEEKKKVNATFREFARIASEDPLSALEYISEKAKEADSNFEYQKYLEKLADQAEKLGKMDEKDRKAIELEKKLAKANQDLSQKEREQNVVLRKQEILSAYPEIGDQRFGQMVDAVLENEELLEGCETAEDVMDQVENLVEETVAQRDIIRAIEQIDPAYANDNDLIFAISDQLKQNPDLEDEDLEEIVREVLGTPKRQEAPRQDVQRAEATRKLSEKQRATVPRNQLRAQGSSDFHLLAAELQRKKQEEEQNRKRSNKLRR